jgi:2-(1,2-epoxy-1,2-dihydrophenyl)acetyl-CoA isomerase
MFETITVTQEGAVATLTLHRPDKLNAFTPVMHRELLEALAEFEQNDTIRAVVLTGSGRAFCAGQDLAAVTEGDPIDYAALLKEGYNPLVQALVHLTKPVVAAVNGVAAGAGASLVMACDLKIASDNAAFIQSFIHVGLIPDSGSTWFLPRQVGIAKAMELALFGDRISATEAERLGLINRVVAQEDLLPEAQAWALRLASLPTKAIAMTKRAFYDGLQSSIYEALDREATLQAAAGETEDHREGIAAFLEKRKAKFVGK